MSTDRSELCPRACISYLVDLSGRELVDTCFFHGAMNAFVNSVSMNHPRRLSTPEIRDDWGFPGGSSSS